MDERIQVYGASWCPDCRRAKRFLADQRILPGEEELIGAGIPFCATCDGPFYRGSKQLLVLGGGNSGLEEGLFLTGFTEKVTLLEHGDQLRGSRVLQDKVRMHPRMEVFTSTW